MKCKQFKIGDIFIQERGKESSPAKVLDGDVPMIAEIDGNNGFTKYAKPTKIFNGNAITISVNFAKNVFYQPVDFCASVNILIIRNDFLNERNAQYICSVLKKNNEKYDYQNKISKERLNDTVILLPTSDGINPDYEYMDSVITKLEQEYIIELEQKRVTELDKYLKATGLTDYKLNNTDLEILNNICKFKKFKVRELFDIHPTKAYHLKNANLLSKNGTIPVVANTSKNNGIGGYSNLLFTENGGIITFSDTTTADSIFYQPKDFIGYSHVQGLYPCNNLWNEKSLHYFLTAFKKVALNKNFDYANKFNRKLALDFEVYLPSKDGINPDYNYMEKYITVIEKLTIKDVVDYKDKIISLTKQVCSKNN